MPVPPLFCSIDTQPTVVHGLKRGSRMNKRCNLCALDQWPRCIKFLKTFQTYVQHMYYTAIRVFHVFQTSWELIGMCLVIISWSLHFFVLIQSFSKSGTSFSRCTMWRQKIKDANQYQIGVKTNLLPCSKRWAWFHESLCVVDWIRKYYNDDRHFQLFELLTDKKSERWNRQVSKADKSVYRVVWQTLLGTGTHIRVPGCVYTTRTPVT